jgi:16S rRNA (guanine527-N7)-methyltransferase
VPAPLRAGAAYRVTVVSSPDSPVSVGPLKARVAPWVLEVLEDSAERGFLGTMAATEQIDHALGFVLVAEAALGGAPEEVVDLGTGGGLPGLVLLSCWPDSRMVLLDANQKRTAFLSSALSGRSGEGWVDVVRGRAEDVGRDDRMRHRFDLVVSRSFGPPAVAAECGAPLLRQGGIMVVSEPPDTPDNDRWPVEGLDRLGLTARDATRVDGRFGYQVLESTGPTPDRYPRRSGIPSKRPLF